MHRPGFKLVVLINRGFNRGFTVISIIFGLELQNLIPISNKAEQTLPL